MLAKQPLPKATIVSVMNFPLLGEDKPQLSPGSFDVYAAAIDDFAVTPIADAIQYIPQLDHKTMIVPVAALDLAWSIVNDWSTAQLQTEPPDAMPGLFAVDGHYDKAEIEELFADELAQARERHTNWAQRLLQMADDLWTERKKYRDISDTMRHAARFLKVDREWIRRPRPEDLQKCPACTMNVPKDAVLCMHCTAVLNKEVYATIQFAGR